MKLIDATTKTICLDNSSLESICTCPRKTKYKLIDRRVTSKPQPATRFGTFIHSALAYRYRCEALGISWSEDTQMRILDRLFTKTPCEAEEWRNISTAQSVISKYNLEYSHDPITIEKVGGFPLVEKSFAVLAGKIGAWTIYYIGRIDLVHRQPGGLIVRDHKTTSVLGETYWQDAAISPQGRGYCWALRQYLHEEPLGYEINVLATRKPSKTGTPIEFARRQFFTRGQLDTWHSNLMEKAEYLVWLIQRDRWPTFEHFHCISKYGVCEFYQVCELPPSQQGGMLASSEYTDNNWTPLRT